MEMPPPLGNVAILLLMLLLHCLSGSTSETTMLYDDFSGSGLDPSIWKIAKRQWGGFDANGGVIPENVEILNGKLILRANGDLYDGPLAGINKDLSKRSNGKRTGAAVATNNYFASGRYVESSSILFAFDSLVIGICLIFARTDVVSPLKFACDNLFNRYTSLE